MSRKTNLIYFQKLSIENVRCFGERQELNLTDDGRPAQWTLVIGDMRWQDHATPMLGVHASRVQP